MPSHPSHYHGYIEWGQLVEPGPTRPGLPQQIRTWDTTNRPQWSNVSPASISYVDDGSGHDKVFVLIECDATITTRPQAMNRMNGWATAVSAPTSGVGGLGTHLTFCCISDM